MDNDKDFSVEDEVMSIWSWFLQPAEGKLHLRTIRYMYSVLMTVLDTEVAENVGVWEPPSNVRDTRLSALVSTWFHECNTNHASCKLQTMSNRPRFQPTRLLDLSDVNSCGRIKLVTRPSDDTVPPVVHYAAVSHCWGKAKTLKLMSTNIDSLRDEGIKLNSLPTSYQEAIHFAMELRIDYIWIDSLCIIQDSQRDWLSQAGLMDQVYLNAEICIALAGAAENQEHSFTLRSDDKIRPLRITTKWDSHDLQDYFLVDEFITKDHSESVLRHRAWVVQERAVSRRILSLGKVQAWYHCLEAIACETYTNWFPARFKDGYTLVNRDDPYLGWESLVEEYTRAQLTFPSDRVAASVGFSNYIGNQVIDELFAGLWKSKLPLQLMWRSLNEDQAWRPYQTCAPAYRPHPRRAPTWSWLSVEAPIEFLYRPTFAEEGSITALCTLLDIQVDPVSNVDGPYYLEGKITLQSELHPIKLYKDHRLTRPSNVGNNGAEFITTSTSVQEHFGGSIPYISAYWRSDEAADSDHLKIGRWDENQRYINVFDIPGFEYFDAFCMPVLEYLQEGFPITHGLILKISTEQPEIYERIGDYVIMGDEERSHLPKTSWKSITIM